MNTTPTLTIYYDGHCRICRDQRDRFARLDAGRGLLRQLDLNDPDFDPSTLGTTRDKLAQALHASTPDGRLLSGMDAVRAAYRALGKGRLLAPTGWPLLRPIFDALYRQLARHRYRIAGKCEDGACKLHE